MLSWLFNNSHSGSNGSARSRASAQPTRAGRASVLGVSCAVAIGWAGLANAQQAARPADAVTGQTLAERYCSNITDAAQDARFAWQAKTISDMEKELEKRIAAIEERSVELKAWVEQREKFLKLANDGLVEIYSIMRADAAAPQLAAMNEVTAAAIIMKLPPKVAGAVLSEMEAEKAARMTATIAGAGRAAKRNRGGES